MLNIETLKIYLWIYRYFVFLKSLLVYSLLRADNMYMQDPIKWFVKLILAKAFHSTIQCYAS